MNHVKKALLERAAENAFQNNDMRLANAIYDHIEKIASGWLSQLSDKRHIFTNDEWAEMERLEEAFLKAQERLNERDELLRENEVDFKARSKDPEYKRLKKLMDSTENQQVKYEEKYDAESMAQIQKKKEKELQKAEKAGLSSYKPKKFSYRRKVKGAELKKKFLQDLKEAKLATGISGRQHHGKLEIAGNPAKWSNWGKCAMLTATGLRKIAMKWLNSGGFKKTDTESGYSHYEDPVGNIVTLHKDEVIFGKT